MKTFFSTIKATVAAWLAALALSLKSGLFGYVWERTVAAWTAVYDALPVAVTQNGAVTWLWGWAKYIVGATWRSFWTVAKTPMTYPILGLVAVLCFSTGHGMGRRGYRDLASAYSAVYNSNEALRLEVKRLRAASEVVTSVPPKASVAPKVAPKPVKAAVPQRRKSVKPKSDSGLFGF